MMKYKYTLQQPTCNPFHPGGVVNAQVAVEDLEDVSQDDTEVF